MKPDIVKPARLASIEALPADIREHALVDWRTVAAILGSDDVKHTRDVVTKAGVPLVRLTERRALPRWGALRDFLKSREQAA
jgi:hypothetical protein